MDFGLIKMEVGEISLSEWNKIIHSSDSLIQAPDVMGTDPFTNEEVCFPGEGIAHYLINNEKVGNISLEYGELLTTGVSLSFCNEIAIKIGAKVFEDDRS